MGCSWAIAVALWWPCGGFCLRAWRVLSLLGYLFPAELGGLLEGLEGLRPGKRQPWTPIRSHCCGRGVLLSHCCGLVVALWWLLPAGVARVGLIGIPFPCGVGQTFGGVGRFGGFEAWQTAALNAYKRSHCCGRGVLLSHCCGLVVAFACSVGRGKSHCCRLVVAFACGRGACGGALQPLLWPCGGFCVREWRVLSLLGYLFPAELGGPLGGLERLRPGKRQPWTPIRGPYNHCCGRGVPFSHCCGLVVAFALGYLFPAELGGLLEGLRPGKRQPWTPIRSHCCGRGCPWAIAVAGGCPSAIAVAFWWLLRAGVARVGLVGVPFPCGAVRTFGGFQAWQTAALSAYKKPLLRPGGALEPLLRPGGTLEPLLWPCGDFCLRAWRVLSLLGYFFPAELGGLLEDLRPGKRQPWAPIRSHCCGRGVPLSHCCGLVVAFACGRGALRWSQAPPRTWRRPGSADIILACYIAEICFS